MKTTVTTFLAVVVLAILVFSHAAAQMPKTLNYQGTLATGSTPVPDGNYNVTFRLYAASSGGSAVWTEAQLVSTRNGVFNAILGKVVALPGSFNTSYWMSLQVGADPELSPRLEMTGVSYSMYTLVADSARKVADASVTTAMLANNSVTTAKIVDGTITGADVANASLTSADVLDEPGVSVSDATGFSMTGGNIRYTMDSVDISIPAAGMVMVTATGYLNLFHTNGLSTQIAVAISKTPATAHFTDPGAQLAGAPSVLPTGIYQFPYSTARTYQESTAGSKRYYFSAWYVSGSNTSSNVYSSYTTALYVPSLLGTLSKIGGDLSTPLERRGSDDSRPMNR